MGSRLSSERPATVNDSPNIGIEGQRWAYLAALDDELLQGGHMMSECAVELLRNADVCYVNGAFVAGIVMAAAAVETWIRAEPAARPKATFYELLGDSDLSPEVIVEVHALRKMRNRWVHVDDPNDDQELLGEFNGNHPKLEAECRAAMRTVRRVLYSCPWV